MALVGFEASCTKLVCNIKHPPYFNKTTPQKFINDCAESAYEFKKKESVTIDIFANVNDEDFFKAESEFTVSRQDLSFEITDAEIVRISNDIIRIFRNPALIGKYLKPLDQELHKAMQEIGIELGSQKSQFLINGFTSFVAGPPQNDYQPLKKKRILDRILLEHEREHGINPLGVTPRFIGHIPGKYIANFVSRGHLFTEDEQTSRILLHGKYTHRLAFEVIRQALACGNLNFSLQSGEQLTQIQLLEMLNKVKIIPKDQPQDRRPLVLWEMVIDNTTDSLEAVKLGLEKDDFARRKKIFNPQYYSYSSRSPFVFKSLLTCFGEELGLEHLQSYLLDSHWKQVERMKIRLLEKVAKNAPKIADDDLYSSLVLTLSDPGDNHIGNLSPDYPFTKSEITALSDPKYRDYSDTHIGIKFKESPSTTLPGDDSRYYKSLANYRAQNNKEI